MKKIKQTEIAKVLDCSQSRISKFYNDRLDISVKEADKVEKSLGIPMRAWLDIKSYLEKEEKSE